MKLRNLSLLVLVSSIGFAPFAEAKCGRDLTDHSIEELPVFTGAPATGDYIAICDTSANRIKKMDASAMTLGGSLVSPVVSGNLTLGATSFIVGSSADGIVAHSGGGKPSATALTASINRVSTVAADHDSVILPVALAGMEIAIDNDGAKILDIYPNGSDTIEDGAGPVSVTAGSDISIVIPATGKAYLQAGGTSTPVACGGTCTLGTGSLGNYTRLDTAAGSVATLPAATGTGNVYKLYISVATSSAADKVLTNPTTDTIIGTAQGENAGTAKVFVGNASTYHSIQMPFAGTQPSGGFIGDTIVCTDVASTIWKCDVQYQAGTTPTTPYSASTS